MSAITMRSEFPGRVSAIEAGVGDRVGENDHVVILESMKMEIPLAAPAGGVVSEILVAVGDTVDEGQEILVIEP